MATTKEGLDAAVQDDFHKKLAQCFAKYSHWTREKSWDPDTRLCHLHIESATVGPPPTVSFRLTIIPEMCNNNGDLHGGCATSYMDSLTSVLIGAISRPGFYSRFGVSRTLNVTFFRPSPQGTEVRLVCTVVNAGKRMASLRAELFRLDTGELCVTGENDKVNTDLSLQKI